MADPAQLGLCDVLNRLRKKIPAIQAVILAGPTGPIESILEDPALNLETVVGEYATLLRIADRTSEDTGAGHLIENIAVSENSIMIARSLSSNHFLIVLFRSREQIGRVRYELKQAAWEIQGQGI